MGLDQYAYVCDKDSLPKNQEVDFDPAENAVEFFYWRKHPDLHGWMHKLYLTKGGSSHDFNCSSVKLNEHDLDELKAAIEADSLPATTGFFFDISSPEKNLQTLEFIKQAKEHLSNGRAVYYNAWF